MKTYFFTLRKPAFKFACAFALNAFIAKSALAQAPAPAAQQSVLPSVVVTASRLPQNLRATIANTTLLSRADIDRSGATDLPSLLAGQAGIELGRNGGAGQLTNLFLRGTNSAQTLVLIDGVPVNDNNFGTANLELLPLDAIERIEIVRGNVSAQYGSHAIGGVIQLFTRAPTAGLNGTASVELGTQGHKKILTSLAAGNDATQLRLSLSQWKINGISAKDAAVNSSANHDHDGTTQTTVQLGLHHRINDTLSMKASHLQNKQSVAYDGYGLTTDVEAAKQTMALSQIGLSWAMSPRWMSVLNVSQQSNVGKDTANAKPFSDNDSRRQLLAFSNRIQLSDAVQLAFGIDHERNRFMANNYEYASYSPNKSRQINAYYANLQAAQGAWLVNLALRRDAAKDIDGGSANSYQLGASYALSPSWSVRAQSSTAFMRPTMMQQYDSYSGNALLKPEQARNQELGVQWASGAQSARLTWFAAKTRNLIDSDTASPTYAFANIAQSQNKGLELMAQTSLPWTGGQLKINFNQQNPIDLATGELLSRRAKFSAGIVLEGQLGAWFWNTSLKHQSARDDSVYSTDTLAAYTRLDAGLRYAINSKFDVLIALQNLNKAKDQTAYGYSATPRGGLVRVSYKL